MGRTSKLSQDAWAQIERRLAGGAGVRMLAREYGVDASAISRRFSQQTQQVRDLARRLVDVQNDVATLPVQQQHLVLRLADELRQITGDLTRAARAGAATAHHLATQAHQRARKIGRYMPLEDSMAELEGVGALTAAANSAAEVGLKLLQTCKSTRRDRADFALASHGETRVKRVEIVPMKGRPHLD